MRSCAWLIFLLGCGRIGFDASGGLSPDGAPPLGDPLVSVDPRTLPPFGSPQLVPLSDAGFEDDDPCLTRDQLEIFFDSQRDGDNDLFTARRSSIAEPWSAPVPVVELNDSDVQEHPQISSDGLTLYFTVGFRSAANLWVSTRADRDSPFAPPRKIENVNSTVAEAMGAVDARSLVMVFSSARAGEDTDDLFQSRRASASEPWPAPVAVAELNTNSPERAAHLDDYGLVMYYELGEISELRWTTRTDVGSAWGASTALDELDTPSEEESDPWLSPDLRTIYFVSDRTGVKDIYMATR